MMEIIEFIQGRSQQVLTGTLEHAVYVVSVIVSASIVSVGLGIAVRNRPTVRELSLGVASVFLTIPALALFVIIIAVLGLGFWPPFVALFMYAILPILRNTVTGINGVPEAVLESARGMGLSARQIMLRVQLPMAWPVIITGIRVSTLLVTGIAALATLVAGGGLGDIIKYGFGRVGFPNALPAIWAGTILIVALALVFDAAFALVGRLTTSKGLR